MKILINTLFVLLIVVCACKENPVNNSNVVPPVIQNDSIIFQLNSLRIDNVPPHGYLQKDTLFTIDSVLYSTIDTLNIQFTFIYYVSNSHLNDSAKFSYGADLYHLFQSDTFTVNSIYPYSIGGQWTLIPRSFHWGLQLWNSYLTQTDTYIEVRNITIKKIRFN